MKPELIVALDVSTAAEVPPIVEHLSRVAWFKVGLELFTAAGPDVLAFLSDGGHKVFLDLKFHDIPRTVQRAVTAAARHKVALLTVHAAGGRAMMRAAADAAAACGPSAPRLIGVTTLTSLGPEDLKDIGVLRTMEEQALRLGDLALTSGLQGLVTSVHEVASLRRRFGDAPLLVAPGIRPLDSAAGDQKRTATPAAAVQAGASFLVVGRPILDAIDRARAADLIMDEMERAWTAYATA